MSEISKERNKVEKLKIEVKNEIYKFQTGKDSKLCELDKNKDAYCLKKKAKKSKRKNSNKN